MAQSQPQTVRVLIVDDHRMFADALAAQLELDERIDVVGVASSPRDAVALAGAADVALVDLTMPAMDGLELTRSLRREQPRIRVVLVSGRPEDQLEDARRASGADAYLQKGSLGAEVGDVIVDVAGT